MVGEDFNDDEGDVDEDEDDEEEVVLTYTHTHRHAHTPHTHSHTLAQQEMPIGVAFTDGVNETMDELVFEDDIFIGTLKSDAGRVLTDRNEARIATLIQDNDLNHPMTSSIGILARYLPH